MSWVTLLAADHPATLYRAPEQRTRFVRIGVEQNPVREDGFSVLEHEYYRQAVDDLGYSMKPYQYEMNLRATPADLKYLRGYLEEHFAPGEEVELWGVWVGGEEERPARFRGPLDGLDIEELERLERAAPVCLTVEM